MVPDGHELVDGDHPGQDHIGPYGDVSGQGGIVAENTAISHNAVMGNMAIGHDQAVVANDRLHTVRGSLVDRGTLPYGGIVPDMDRGVLPLVLQVLGHGRNDRPGEYTAVLSDSGTLHDRDIGADPGTLPNGHIVVDGGKGLDHHILGDLGSRVYIC